MKNQTACFTGHRDMSMPLGEVKRRLNEVIDQCHLVKLKAQPLRDGELTSVP